MECAFGCTRAKICLSLQCCMSASMLMAMQKVAEKYEKTQKWKHGFGLVGMHVVMHPQGEINIFKRLK